MGQRNIKRLYDASQAGGVPITATVLGVGPQPGPGNMPPGVGMGIVTATNSAHRVFLPLNVIGTVLWLSETTSSGYELCASTVGATIEGTVFDGVAAGAEANVPASLLLMCHCVSALIWIIVPHDVNGDVVDSIDV